MQLDVDGVKLEITTGDISNQPDVAAVVNAANAQLVSGGGVAGALHEAAGPQLAAAGRAYAPLEPGDAVLTSGFELPNRYVIHCLGPVYGEDEPARVLLASCYRNAMKIAEENEIQSIAFPALSTGAFGYPMDEAADVAIESLLNAVPGLRHVRLIRIVLYSDRDRTIVEQTLERRYPDARQ